MQASGTLAESHRFFGTNLDPTLANSCNSVLSAGITCSYLYLGTALISGLICLRFKLVRFIGYGGQKYINSREIIKTVLFSRKYM